MGGEEEWGWGWEWEGEEGGGEEEEFSEEVGWEGGGEGGKVVKIRLCDWRRRKGEKAGGKDVGENEGTAPTLLTTLTMLVQICNYTTVL